jgi:tetraacyldisaccharide-1-P 4'-kinase
MMAMIPDYRIPRSIRQGAGFVWMLVGAVHRSWRRRRRPALAPPVLVVGALRAGGSGKTDCVDWIARRHPDLALLVHPTGDEDRMLRGRFPGRVFIHRDLLRAWAAAREAGFVRGVSDGGLQDPALDGCPALVLGRMRADFHELHPCGPYRQRRPARPVQLEVGETGPSCWRHEIDLPHGSRVLVGAGVARTENIVQDLRGLGVETAAVLGSGDHRRFPTGQVELLERGFPELPWVITAKDQARGEAGRLRAPVHVLRRELQIDPELACRIDALVEAL